MPYVGKKPADIIATAVDTTTGTFSGDLTVDTSTLYVDSANNRVGVGTTSLTNVLHVHQTDATANSYVHITQADGGSGGTDGLSIGIEDGGVNAVIRNRENGYLRMYTNNTERARIDGSGNLLVGTTDTSLYNNTSGGGLAYRPNNELTVAAETSPQFIVNNTGSDGEMVRFAKDGTTVGSIGNAASTELYIDSGSNGTGLSFRGNHIRPRDNGADVDGTVSLGNSSFRFQDLFLSGGAYIGGTGSANKLDDYEEGSFTPTFSGGGAPTFGIQNGRYTKIGNRVIISLYMSITNKSTMTGTQKVAGLPFTSENVSSLYTAVALFMNNMVSSSVYNGDRNITGFQVNNTTQVQIYAGNNSGGVIQLDASHMNNNSDIALNFAYTV